uniref:Diuretic hormone receptor n=1 Tax=Culicoides sonorensis TaxID=179676 RepID=A0A336K2T2_CULSO
MKFRSLFETVTLGVIEVIDVASTDDSSSPLITTADLDQRASLCLQLYQNVQIKHGDCEAYFDKILCWPPTPNNTLAVLPCPDEFAGIQYDTTKNATRLCTSNGWAEIANYAGCQHVPANTTQPPEVEMVELPTYVYYTGYTISLLALLLAVVVFINFKDLRCLRNTIHANLFVTYIMTSFLWILTLSLQMVTHVGSVGCIFLTILFQYFSLTNFCWMLVEGLYLYMLVVETFSGDNLRFGMYAFIGWGCPAIFVLCWAIARAVVGDDDIDDEFQMKKLEIECSWMREKQIDWIIHGPALAVLAINFVFLIRIMWVVYKVLITKLRSANTAETRQYRKASKALLVLIPLLGITYLVVMTGPTDGVMRSIFDVCRAFLLSTQGFSVSLFFCFLNSEPNNDHTDAIANKCLKRHKAKCINNNIKMKKIR